MNSSCSILFVIIFWRAIGKELVSFTEQKMACYLQLEIDNLQRRKLHFETNMQLKNGIASEFCYVER